MCGMPPYTYENNTYFCQLQRKNVVWYMGYSCFVFLVCVCVCIYTKNVKKKMPPTPSFLSENNTGGISTHVFMPRLSAPLLKAH